MPKSPKPTNLLRLNRALAQAGIASRRKADTLIAAGRVSIDGTIVRKLGTLVDRFKQEISVDGVPLDRPTGEKLYLLMNKPRGVVTTLKDPEGRKTVRDLIPFEDRIFPVGRLDYDAEGALLLTNDGNLANTLTHPRYEVPKTYHVKVEGFPDGETLAKLRRGVHLEDGFARPRELKLERKTKEHAWFKMVVAEGRNHLIKRLWLRVGHPVIKLTRVDFAWLGIEDLKPGEFRPLSPSEIRKLKERSHR